MSIRGSLALQLLLGLISYARIGYVAIVFGVEGLGLVSLVTSICAFLTISSQICNNQGLQSVAISGNVRLARVLLMGNLSLSLFNAIVATSLLVGFDVFTKFHIFSFQFQVLIVLFIWASLINGIFDFFAVCQGRAEAILLSQVWGGILAMVYLLLLYPISRDNSLLAISPAVNGFGILAFYIFRDRDRLPRIGIEHFNPLYALYYIRMFKRSAILNFIPLSSISADFLLKILFQKYVGLSGVGVLQLFQSVESSIGNIFAGPLYRKALFSFRSRPGDFGRTTRIYAVTLILPLLVLSGVLLLLPFVNKLTFKEFDTIARLAADSVPVAIFVLLRIPSLLWGLIGQLILAKGGITYIAYIEVAGRILLVVACWMLFRFFSGSIYNYLVASAGVGVFLVGAICYGWFGIGKRANKLT